MRFAEEIKIHDVFAIISFFCLQVMNTNHAMSLYFSFFAFETLRVVLTVFRRWGGAKEKVEGDSGGKGPRGGASRDSSSQRTGTLSRRGGGSNRSSSAEKKAKSSEASTSSSSSNPSGISRFFSLFDGDLRFMTGMWDRPSLCFHLGNKRFNFFSVKMLDKNLHTPFFFQSCPSRLASWRPPRSG